MPQRSAGGRCLLGWKERKVTTAGTSSSFFATTHVDNILLFLLLLATQFRSIRRIPKAPILSIRYPSFRLNNAKLDISNISRLERNVLSSIQFQFNVSCVLIWNDTTVPELHYFVKARFNCQNTSYFTLTDATEETMVIKQQLNHKQQLYLVDSKYLLNRANMICFINRQHHVGMLKVDELYMLTYLFVQ